MQQAKNLGLTSIGIALQSEDPSLDPAIFGSKENAASINVPTLTVAPDTTAPQATFSAPNVTSASTNEKITITYTDDAGLNATTIDKNDLSVTGPSGVVAVSGVTVDASNPDSVVATYSLTTPGGQWTSADNGAYTVTLQPGQVIDLGDNAAVGGPGTFQVSLAAAPDTQAPTASSLGSQSHRCQRDRTCDGRLSGQRRRPRIDDRPLQPQGCPRWRNASPGYRLFGESSGRRPCVTATYTLAPPAGGWTAASNGTYVDYSQRSD